mgnify:CR=1 FL=1
MNSQETKLPGDIIVLPEGEGRWVVMNIFAHTCIGVESSALCVLRDSECLNMQKLQAKYSKQKFKVWEINWFSNYEGLLADPTRYIRNVADWPEAENLEVVALVNRFKQHYLLIEDVVAYRSRFAPKCSLVDGEHFGNFHQQLGQKLFYRDREMPNKWWMQQKFTGDMLNIRENLYKAVQEYFLGHYFQRKFSKADVIVDIGCGPGFFTNLIAKTGASVLGVDPSEESIRMAKKYAVDGARFEVVQVSKAGAMDHIPSDSADFVFMGDALLFYFVPMMPDQVANIQALFGDIRRILKPDGCFISAEPHYIFWLLPWFGDVDRPFTVITEYLHKVFGITPNTSQLIQAYINGGFAVTWMDEFTPDPAFESVDPRAYYFARQFPLWHIFELKPL